MTTPKKDNPQEGQPMIKEKSLTAAEAADRVAARYRNRTTDIVSDCAAAEPIDAEEIDADDEPLYACENCGGHDLQVVHAFELIRNLTRTLLCVCDSNADEAACQEMTQTEYCTSVGDLGEDHRVEWCDEESEVTETDYDQPEVSCSECYDNACDDGLEWEDWEASDDDPEIIEEEDRWEVRCANCDHEIEFGWSHLDGGRIWPCESSDFNPWKCFPDKRFRDDWRRRGWMRPARAHQVFTRAL